MKTYIDKLDDRIIETSKYILSEEFFGFSFKKHSDYWIDSIEVDFDDLGFNHIDDFINFDDYKLNSILDRFVNMRIFK